MSIRIKFTINLDGDVDADLVAFINSLGKNERNSEIVDILREHIAHQEGRSRSEIILEMLTDLGAKLDWIKEFIESNPSGELKKIGIKTESWVSGGNPNYEIDVEVSRNLMELGK